MEGGLPSEQQKAALEAQVLKAESRQLKQEAAIEQLKAELEGTRVCKRMHMRRVRVCKVRVCKVQVCCVASVGWVCF